MNIISLQNLVFIVGFLTSFITVFLSKFSDHVCDFSNHEYCSKEESSTENLPQNTRNYNIWRQNQNIKISQLDLDNYIYGKNNRVLLESEWLKNKVPVTCVVFVEKLKLAAAIKDTWGSHCNQILFFSQRLTDVEIPIIDLKIKFTSSWQLLCEAMNYIWKRRHEIPLNWIIFVRDDTFVILENLRYMLAPLDYKEPHYLGHSVILWGSPYNVAHAGYVLSYEVLFTLMKKFNSPEKCASGGKYWKNEDYYLGKHLASLGILPSDTRDVKQRGTFHGFSLNVMLWSSAKPDSYFTRALFPVGPECCSDKSITFNIAETNKMWTVNYLIYHLNLFESAINGIRAAPTSIPEDEVWKSVLREEFNVTNFENISSEKYFQMWKTKYLEPELFISKNLGNKRKP